MSSLILLWSRHCLLVGCLTSQQQASVSQGRICSDNFTCCHTEIEVADPTFYLTQSQYTDTGPTSPSADPITPGAWQGSHWNANFKVIGMTRPRKNPGASGIRTRDLPLSRRTPSSMLPYPALPTFRTSERLPMGLEHSCSPRSNTSIKNQTASLNISNRQSCSRILCLAQLRTALTTRPTRRSGQDTRLLGLCKASTTRTADMGSILAFAVGLLPDSIIPVT